MAKSAHEPLARRSCRRRAALRCGLLLLAAAAPATGQPPEPAAVGRDRPLTSTWLCENDRSVLLNAHPRRRAEEAWLTYAGTRVAVMRRRSASGVAFASSDGKVKWFEKGDEATLEFADLADGPVACRRQDRAPR